MIRAIGVFVVAAFIVCVGGLVLVNCGAAAPTPADVAVSTSYGTRLGECVLTAKELDASSAVKHASADGCMCRVALDAGQADDPVLNCDGGAS